MSPVATAPTRVPAPPERSNGSSPAGQRVGVGRQRRISWIMLGLLLTAGAALAFIVVLSSAGNRVTVVAAAHDLQPGQPIKASDLRTVSLGADDSVRTLAADRASDLVGRVPLAPLSSGTVLHAGLFATGSDLAAGETVVGAALRPGELPGANLRPGDRVALVRVASNNPTDAGESSVLGVGTIYSVAVPKDAGDIVVGVRVPIDRGAGVANAAGQKRLRLLLVPPDTSADQLDDSNARLNQSTSSAPGAKSAPSGSQPVRGN